MVDVSSVVKRLFNCDNCKKNFIIKFPYNESLNDITNENLVEDSVKYTESICSRDVFKVGIIESPTIEFETVDIPNIKGEIIECYLQIDNNDYLEFCEEHGIDPHDIDNWNNPIPYGTFIVDSCVRQKNLSHRKITAYGLNVADMMSSPNEQHIFKVPSRTNSTYKFDPVKRALTFLNNYDDYEIWGSNKILKGITESIDDDYVYPEGMSMAGPYCSGVIEEGPNKGYDFEEWFYLKIKRNCYKVNNIEDLLLTSYFPVMDNDEVERFIDDFINDIKQHNSYVGDSITDRARRIIREACTNAFIVTETVPRDSDFRPIYTYFKGGTNRNFYLKTDVTVKRGKELCQYIGVFESIDLSCSRYIGHRKIAPFDEDVTFKNYHFTKDILKRPTEVYYIENDLFGLYEHKKQRYAENHLEFGRYYYLKGESDVNKWYEYLMGFFELNHMVIGPGMNKKISLKDLSNNLIYPNNNLFPNDDLVFKDITLLPGQTKDIEYDEEDYSISYVIADYNIAGDEEPSHYEELINENGNLIYDLNDNILLQLDLPTNKQENLKNILNDFSEFVKRIKYRPVNITIRGLPFLEVGDVIKIKTKDEIFSTIIMRQTISGITIIDQQIESSGGD